VQQETINQEIQSHELRLVIEKNAGTGFTLCINTRKNSSDPIHITRDKVDTLTSRLNLLDMMVTNPSSSRFTSDLIKTGQDLFQLFLSPFKGFNSFVKDRTIENSPVLINVQTESPLIHALPWELLCSDTTEDGCPFLAAHPRFILIKTSMHRSTYTPNLSEGPLRVLCMSLSPEDEDLALLNYEKEEQILMDAVASLKLEKRLDLDIAVLGTMEELKERLSEKEYHVLHLSGHGCYADKDQTGYIFFEKPDGSKNKVSAQDLALTLLGYQSVRLVFLSACESCKGVMGVASALLHNGIPMVVGMMNSVQDKAARDIAQHFYTALAYKQSPEKALQTARIKYREESPRKNFQWAIPSLYSAGTHTAIVDWDKPLKSPAVKKRPVVLYGKISHLPAGFVGRRNMIREFISLFRERKPPAYCMTGAGGIGKSTLSTRLAEIQGKAGYTVVPLRGELTAPSSAAGTRNINPTSKASPLLMIKSSIFYQISWVPTNTCTLWITLKTT
jgi:CHAT domain-containing protein